MRSRYRLTVPSPRPNMYSHCLGVYFCLLLSCDAQTCPPEDKSMLLESESSTCDGVNRRHLSILLATGFWPGHLYPITALGEELVERGQNVTLCATVMEGSDLLPALPHSYGINFISAGPDNLTQESYSETMKRLQNLTHQVESDSMDFFTKSSSWTASKVHTKVSEIIDNFDILISDISVLAVGVYHAKRGTKSIIFTPVIPYVHATLSERLTLLGGTENGSFVEMLMNQFISHSLMINATLITAVNIDRVFNPITTIYDYYSYPGIHIPLICNTVLGFDFPKTHLPLMHYVGPLLMQTTPPLDISLQDWLSTKQDKSVIYVGMGSIGLLSKEYIMVIFDGILTSSFDAVWSLSTDEQAYLENVDKNRFYVSKWIPRQTLFKHQTIAMTLMHCGLNGVQESLSNGLPVICAPLFFDHFEVADRLNAAHVGIPLYGIMDVLSRSINITAEVITSTIKSIAENRTYSEQIKKMQKMYSLAGGAKRASDLVEFYAEVGYDHLIPAYAKYGWGWVHFFNLAVYSIPSLLLSAVLLVMLCCTCARPRHRVVEQHIHVFQ